MPIPNEPSSSKIVSDSAQGCSSRLNQGYEGRRRRKRPSNSGVSVSTDRVRRALGSGPSIGPRMRGSRLASKADWSSRGSSSRGFSSIELGRTINNLFFNERRRSCDGELHLQSLIFQKVIDRAHETVDVGVEVPSTVDVSRIADEETTCKLSGSSVGFGIVAPPIRTGITGMSFLSAISTSIRTKSFSSFILALPRLPILANSVRRLQSKYSCQGGRCLLPCENQFQKGYCRYPGTRLFDSAPQN